MVFTDEARFCLGSDDLSRHVWRRFGERDNLRIIVRRHTAVTPGVTVWGAISFEHRSTLDFLADTLTARRYVKLILKHFALPFARRVSKALFQQVNARPHAALITKQCPQTVNIVSYPALSPDLSITEHVKATLGRQLHYHPQSARTLDELWEQVQASWSAISQKAFLHLYDTM